jgi:hypothetical protein
VTPLPNRKDEARELGERLLMTLKFIEQAQDFPSGAQFRSIVESEMARGRLRALKLIARDVDEMVLTLAPNEREGLEAILSARTGFEAEATWQAERTAVEHVLRTGRVRSEKERLRLERFVEALVVRGGDPETVAAVRTLLANG